MSSKLPGRWRGWTTAHTWGSPALDSALHGINYIQQITVTLNREDLSGTQGLTQAGHQAGQPRSGTGEGPPLPWPHRQKRRTRVGSTERQGGPSVWGCLLVGSSPQAAVWLSHCEQGPRGHLREGLCPGP